MKAQPVVPLILAPLRLLSKNFMSALNILFIFIYILRIEADITEV